MADGSDAFEITGISSKDGMVTGKVIGKTDEGGVRMQFTFTAPTKPGYHNGEVMIETNVDKVHVLCLKY